MTWDLAQVWLEVGPDIVVPAPVADFIYSYQQWVSDNEGGTFQAAPPLGWDQQDLCTLGYLLANKEFLSARGLLESMLSPPMVMLPTSSLMEANNNYLLKNPFRVRKRRRKKKNKDTRDDDDDEGEVHAGDSIAKQDPLPDEGETKQDLLAGDDKAKQDRLSCDEGDGGKDVDDNICDDGNSSTDCGNDTSDDNDGSKGGGNDDDSKKGGDDDDSKEGGDDSNYGGGGSKVRWDDCDSSNNGCKGVTRNRRSVSLKKGKEACAIIHIPTLDRYAQVKKKTEKQVFHCQPISESLFGLAFN